MRVRRLLLIASLAFEADGHRVADQPRMETMETTTEATTTTDTEALNLTNVTSDPLAPLLLQEGLLSSPENGCTMQTMGWYGEYFTDAGALAMSVKMNPLSTTFRFMEDYDENSKEGGMLSSMEDSPKCRTGPNGDLACTHKNEDLARMFCSAGRDFHELCTFFILGNIQKFCTKQAGKKIAAVAKMPFTAAHAGYKSIKNYLFGSK